MEKFQDIINSSTPVLVDFFATWCGPCKMMHPILEDLSKEIGDKARILKVDIDKNEQLAAAYKVMSVPTLMIFKDGKMMWRAAGVHSADALKSELGKYF